MIKAIKKIVPRPLVRLFKKCRNNEFSKSIFRPFNLRKALVFPMQVQIESTSFCNAQCLHCEYKNLKRTHAHMKMDLYRKIIDQCFQFKKYCKSIGLHFMGEPLLDPTFFEKLEYVKQKNSFFVMIYSNGSLLTQENCQRLIDSKLDEIVFSVDGATKETFESIRVGLSYEKVAAGIKRLADLKKKLNVKSPHIEVRMVLTPGNVKEADLFKKTWRGLADTALVRQMHAWSGQIIGKEFLDYSYSHVGQRHNKSTPCFYLWKTMVISQDGKVALCCVDSDVREEIGDLNKETMYEIWHSDKLNRIREMHLAGRSKEISICQGCNFRETKEYPWWWYGI